MTMFSQDQVNQWFAANPNATPEFVAQTVQQAGGLDAHQGLAGLIGQHYGTDANTIINNYNTLANPATPATPVDYSSLVNNAYAGIGRTGVGTDVSNIDQGGLDYWTGQLKSGALTPENFNSAFNNAVYTYAAGNPTDKYTQYVQDYQTSHPTTNQYFVNNPDVAAEYARNNLGMTPDEFATTHYNKFGVNEQRIDPNALSGVAGLYQTYLGRAPESRSAVDAWASRFGSTIEADELAAFREAAIPELRNTGYLSDPFKNETKSYISAVLGDKTLTPQEQAATIMAQAKKVGLSPSKLESIYGKDEVNPYLDVYKTGINKFLTDTLAKEPGTTLNEVGEIHRAAQEFGLTPAEIAKYAGIDPKQAQSYFDAYDQGMVNLMTALKDPKYSETQRTAIALDAIQKYGATDAEFAKASKGKYTEKDIAEYLDPVRNVPTNLQKAFDDPKATAKDILKIVSEAKADPRAAAIYGSVLNKVEAAAPELYLRDAASGKPDMAGSYDSFLKAAKATPELAAKYAPQIKAIEQVNSITNRAVYKDNGGVRSDWMYEMFMGLNPKEKSATPKQLEFTERKTDTATGVDEYGNVFEYERELSPAKPKGEGVEPVWSSETWGDGTYAPAEITGYRKKVDSDVFKEHPYNALYATYDAKGNLTGYESNRQIYTGDRTYYGAKWNADGSAAPYGVQKSRGGFRGFVDSIAEMGPIGTIALMAATGGLGSLAAGALANTAVGAALGTIGTNAVASGLVSGALSDMSGGDFGKGFVGGAVGSGVGSLAQGAMPTNLTGVPMVDTYLAQAAPKAAGSMASAGVTGGDMGDAGLYSLLNTGVNMGTNSLLQNSGIGTLPTSVQPYATGVASNVISSALTGKDPDLEKALTKTMMQQAMNTGKSAVKTANAP